MNADTEIPNKSRSPTIRLTVSLFIVSVMIGSAEGLLCLLIFQDANNAAQIALMTAVTIFATTPWVSQLVRFMDVNE